MSPANPNPTPNIPRIFGAVVLFICTTGWFFLGLLWFSLPWGGFFRDPLVLVIWIGGFVSAVWGAFRLLGPVFRQTKPPDGETNYTTIKTAQTAMEADMILSALRAAGLHPVELSLSPHFSLVGMNISFPIEVPTSETEAAREILDSYERSQTGS